MGPRIRTPVQQGTSPQWTQFPDPEQRLIGQSEAVLANRRAVYEAAKLRHPERWSGKTRNWTLSEKVWLNAEKEESIEYIEELSS